MIGQRERSANLRLLFGHQYTVPGVPLVFMGGELAQERDWFADYLASFEDAPHAGGTSGGGR